MGKVRMRPRATREVGRAARGGEQGKPQNAVLEWAKSIIIAFGLFLLIRTFLVQTFTITSGSMEGTLLVGDFLMLSKSAYGAQIPGTGIRLPGYTELKRGDVIVFRAQHEPDMDLVKRLIGLPGDTLAMREGVLYINGQPQVEPYAEGRGDGMDSTHPWMVWQMEYLAPGVDRAT